MRQHAGEFSVAEMAEALGRTRSGYYRWAAGQPSVRTQTDMILKDQIQGIYRQAQGRYGYRPVHAHLAEAGAHCGRDRTLRLMRELGLEARQASRFKPCGTQSNHGFGYSPNLLGALDQPDYPDQVWVADTTYLWSESGWRYLATVMDLATRRILGWSIAENNDTALVCRALENAVGTRGGVQPGIVHHSDRGSTYASERYQRLLAALQMSPSMSRQGNCYDNAAMESFYGRYKTSSVRGQVFADDAQLRANVFEYIEVFYNRFRKHSALGYQSPMQLEAKFLPPMGGKAKPSCPSHN
jgi:putative transposase